jgi:hypothetical protein
MRAVATSLTARAMEHVQRRYRNVTTCTENPKRLGLSLEMWRSILFQLWLVFACYLAKKLPVCNLV